MKPISKYGRLVMKFAGLVFLLALGMIFGALGRSDPSPLKLLLLVAMSVFAIVVVVHSWRLLDD